MPFPDFSEFSLAFNAIIFAIAAVGVWLVGTKLSQYVDVIAARTGIGRAFAGALLLGGATSLPEIATTITASLNDAPNLAGANLLGGIVAQMAILGLVDAVALRGKALTFFAPQPALLIQGMLLIVLLGVVMAALASGELFSILGVGFWPVLIVLLYAAGLWLIYQYEGYARWEPVGELAEPPGSARDLKDTWQKAFLAVSTPTVKLRFGVAAVLVLLFGVLVAQSGEAIAEQSGIGEGFVGATLVALATSLPELSTTYSAVRFGAYSMAAANILGTNILEIALFLPADLAYRSGPIFNAMDPNVGLLGALGIIVTAVFLWGVLERRDRTIFGMGSDSAIIILVYLLGMLLYYLM